MKKILTILFSITCASNGMSVQRAQTDSVNMPANICKVLANAFNVPVSPLKIPASPCTMIITTPCKNPSVPCNIKDSRKTQESQTRGEAILGVGKKMVFETKEIIKGGCWDYIDVVYTRAGFPRDKRQTIFKEKKDAGSYADLEMLQPGDWLYHINHSYHGVGHSGVFVRWVDKANHIAEMLSYAGESRNEPGRYRNYDLSNVYNVMRGK